MLKLLIVEDEFWVRQRLVTGFDWKGIGFRTVFEAENGQQALELYQKELPDIIITDIRMPLISGLDLIKELKRLKTKSRIIIISGYEDFEFAREALRLGVIDYLIKPIEEFALLESVKNCINATGEELSEQEEPPSDVTRKIIRKALDYMEQNYYAHITMSSVADYVHLSSAYFCRIFREELGHTFTEHLIQMRMNKVCELLADPTLKISEIALEAGFTDMKYFYKLFKRYYHMKPTTYREECLR